jgi:hypothetical protein
MNCHLYLRRGTVYLPTMGKMNEGFYRGVEQSPTSPPRTPGNFGRRYAQRSRAAIRSSRYCDVAKYRRPCC